MEAQMVVDMFLKIDGIQGESTDDSYRDEHGSLDAPIKAGWDLQANRPV
jgi:hypothetical protein